MTLRFKNITTDEDNKWCVTADNSCEHKQPEGGYYKSLPLLFK